MDVRSLEARQKEVEDSNGNRGCQWKPEIVSRLIGIFIRFQF